MDPVEIRAGLKANLEDAISGYQVNDYVLSQPTPPAFEIEPGEISYDAAMGRGADEWTWTVRALVANTLDRGAQMLIDELLAGTAVKDAIESDATLGGAIDDLHVKSARGPLQWVREGGVLLIGAEWTVELLGDGDN